METSWRYFITARVRSTREGNIYTWECLSVHHWWGGYPSPRSGWGGVPRSGWSGGTPSQVWMVGGNPFPGLDGGGYPPGQVWMVGWGYPPARSGWWDGGTLGTPPPPTMTGWGTPPTFMSGWGSPPPPHQHSEHLLCGLLRSRRRTFLLN